MTEHDAHDPGDPEALRQALFRSMALDRPPSGAKQATLAALGLGATAASLAGSVTAKSGIAWGMVSKALATGGLAGVVTMGAFATARHFASTPNQMRPVSSVAPASPGNPASSATTRATTTDLPRRKVAMLPEQRGRRAAESARVPSPSEAEVTTRPEVPEALPMPTLEPVAQQASPPAPLSSLPEETAQLDRVRAALNHGQFTTAWAELDRYHALFPRGTLGPESTVLRIEALVLAGDRTRARDLARSFMATHPNSPHLGRLRTLVGL
jgi:hypothetical protein